MLTIACITDLHVTTIKDPLNSERNARRLRAALEAIHRLRPRPVAIIASGDLVDRGEAEEYATLRDLLAAVEIPVFLGAGNHDRRGPMREVLGPAVRLDEDGFVQYALQVGDLRLVMCDTLDEGRDGGAFCERRAAWLACTLDAAPDTPTVIALHHPPIPSGIRWMDPAPDAPWLGRLAAVLRGRTQVQGLVCGHVHRTFHGAFAGQLVSAMPATSIALTLDLTSIDRSAPDGRELLVEEPVGFGLLFWDGKALTAHACVAGDFAPAVHFTAPFAGDQA